MEYLAKKSFSFLQDFAFISKSILKNIYRFIYFSLVYFFAKNSFISTSKVFYKLCKYVNSPKYAACLNPFSFQVVSGNILYAFVTDFLRKIPWEIKRNTFSFTL